MESEYEAVITTDSGTIKFTFFSSEKTVAGITNDIIDIAKDLIDDATIKWMPTSQDYIITRKSE
jgi:hypothetical protein